jgi:hypothetical protein
MTASHGDIDRAVRAIAPTSRNPVRVRNVTCLVCTRESPGYERCRRCAQHLAQASQIGVLLADRVAPLRYAIRSQQSYIDAWAYKDPSTPPERNHALQRLKLLTYLFTVTHGRCLDAVSGTAVSAVAVVPSLSRPGQPHALEQVAQYLPYHWTRVPVSAATALPVDRDLRRDLNPAFMVINERAAVAGRHVVVFDDTWTTGGHA